MACSEFKFKTTSNNGFQNSPYFPLIIVIAVNCILFLTLGLLKLLGVNGSVFLLTLIGPFGQWIYYPWGILTYMFVQLDVVNLLFNMMWLWAFGAIILRFERKSLFLSSYIAGGLVGGLAFLTVSTLWLAQPASLYGSSSAVIGVITAAAVSRPKLELNLFIFGNLRLIWVALVALLLCGLAPGLGSPFTLSAHFGGLVGGAVAALLMRKSYKFVRFGKIEKKPQYNVRMQERRGLTAKEQSELDSLLDCVKASGYKSLSMKERKRLFELSNRINN